MKLADRVPIALRRMWGALTSRKAAARWAILRRLLQPVTLFLDKFASPFDSPATVTESSRWVLMCSPPRSGSTVLYQVVTRILNCGYVSNLHQLTPRFARGILSISTWAKRNRELSSYYGHTKGWKNVNEGNELVDFWFKTYDRDGIRERFLITMKWLGDGTQPVIIKNVCVYNQIGRLLEAVPDLAIIRIRRDPQQVVESELKGFYELGYFNPLPETMKGESFSDPVAFAVRQILGIEEVLDRQLENVHPGRYFQWSYEEFCENPSEVMAPFCRYLKRDPDWNLLEECLQASSSSRVSEVDARRIAILLKAYVSQGTNR